MFASFLTLIPSPVRSFFMVMAMVVIAATSTTGVGLASTDPNVDPTDTSIDNELMEMCDRAVETFFREIDWILSHDADHPRSDQHVDSMWNAWYFAEVICRIDVGGNGELG